MNPTVHSWFRVLRLFNFASAMEMDDEAFVCVVVGVAVAAVLSSLDGPSHRAPPTNRGHHSNDLLHSDACPLVGRTSYKNQPITIHDSLCGLSADLFEVVRSNWCPTPTRLRFLLRTPPYLLLLYFLWSILIATSRLK
jgi:hypothetical protein